jgi:hypothetical protein
MRKGSDKRKQKTCSTCGKKTRHDRRTCRSQPVRNGRRQRARDREIDGSLSDSPIADVQVDEQFQVEMALCDQRFSRGLLATQQMEAIIASERMEGIVPGTGANIGGGTSDSDSELSTVSSSRYSGLEEGWWKEGAPEVAKMRENVGLSKAMVTTIRMQSRGKRVHWE